MKIITTVNEADYHAWFARALLDDGVWPYLGMTPRAFTMKIENDDWSHRVILSDDGRGCAIIDLNRNGLSCFSLAMWVLSGDLRAICAASLMRDVITLGRRYGMEWIDTKCHGSNVASRMANDKFFGKPWGIEPHGCWNGMLRKLEDCVCYRAPWDYIEQRVHDASATKLEVVA